MPRPFHNRSAALSRGAPFRLDEEYDFGSNPGALRMFMHAPKTLKPGAALVVVLHGCTQDATAYVNGAGWAALANDAGFAVLAPQQASSNNMNRCFNWFEPADTRRGAGEAASIAQMVATAVQRRGLDPKRVYITGLSAGGAMTSVMLAAYPDLFAGGAIVAGLPAAAAADMQQAMSVMHRPPVRSGRDWGELVRTASNHGGPWPKISIWHGDADMTVSSKNADASMRQWLDVHGLDEQQSVREEVGGHRRISWKNRDGDVLVEAFMIAGMGHGVPISRAPDGGGYGRPGPFILEAGICSSRQIAQFWGLSEASERTSVTTAFSAPREQEATPFSAPGRRPAAGPQAVIEKALRAAGLMR